VTHSPRIFLALLATAAALFATAAPASAEPSLPAGFQDELVLDGLSQPTTFRFAPDGSVFVAQKTGEIIVFDEGLGDTTPETFADLRTYVYDTGDRGLLGLALDPEFDEGRPYVYALYTYDHIFGDPDPAPKWGTPGTSGDPCPDTNGGDACLVSGRLVRLTADGDQAEGPVGDPTQQVLAEGWCQQFSSHSVGDLEFGPEGALYASGGDGASFFGYDYGQLGNPVPNPCGDPPSPAGTALTSPSAQGGSLRSQNPELLNGKILRLDPDTGEGLPDNPLSSAPHVNERRTIATGFRNPFRFAFDQQTGDIYTGNVGSSEIEEIDTFPGIPSSVYNSGWPCYEGPDTQFLYDDKELTLCESLYDAVPQLTSDPFFYYSHGQSVVPDDECPIEYGSALGGVSLYEGDKMPGYEGALFFADSVRGCVWVMRAGDDGEPDPLTTERFLRDTRIYPAIDIREGPDGYLYYVNLLGDENGADGGIHKLVYAPKSPKARLSADKTFGTTFPFTANLDAGASSDPDDDPLTYDWDLDEDGTFEIEDSTDPTKQVTYTQAEQDQRKDEHLPLNRIVTVRVSDDESLSSVAAITLYPGDKPPEVTINSPSTTQKWAVGDNIHLQGLATNAKGESMFEPLPYYWSTRVYHCPNPDEPDHCHGHPLQTFAGTRSGDFQAPEHDYPSLIEITLRVASSRGLVGSETILLEPATVNLDFTSSPTGVPLTAGLLQGPSPFTLTAIKGSNVQISAPEEVEIGGKTYVWESWSDGGARERSITASSNKALQANYDTSEVELDFTSLPPGIEITIGSQSSTTPFSRIVEEGEELEISAPQSVELGGKTYAWESWSDGAAREHTITAQSDSTFQAAYSSPEAPKTVKLSVASTPTGIPLVAGPISGPAPFTLTAYEGETLQLSAPESAEVGGDTYDWQSWSDGGARVHTVIAQTDSSYTAAFTKPIIPVEPPQPPTPQTPPPPPPPPTPSDTKPPATKLGAHPPKSTRKTTAKFSFSSSESGSSFRCKLDRKPFKTCRSPQKLKRLKPGRHTFKVIATDAAGNADATAASFRWKVLAPRPRR